MYSLNNKPTAKDIYIWNILGSMANALMSVVVLMIVTRVLNDEKADIFSVSWSIAQLMAIIGSFQIRTYQATDIAERFKFGQYLIFRVVTIGVMLVSSVGYVLFKGYDTYKSLIVIIVCLFRAVDVFADVYEGWFQQKERLDLSGKALASRVVVAVIGFGISLLLTKDLLIACLTLLISYVFCFFVFDFRYCIFIDELKKKDKWGKSKAWIIDITKQGAPIFINAFLLMAINNAPKMVIDNAISIGKLEQGVQSIYNILFMPASVLNLAYIVFRPLITRMAIMWTQQKIKEYLKMIRTIVLCLLCGAVAVLIGCAFLGIPLLSFLYAIDLGDYKMSLLVLVIGGCFSTLSCVLDNALVVMRKQYLLAISYVVSCIYIEIVAKILVNLWGVLGASIAYATAMLVILGVTLVIFLMCLKVNRRDRKALR